jgi:hypothetical protein
MHFFLSQPGCLSDTATDTFRAAPRDRPTHGGLHAIAVSSSHTPQPTNRANVRRICIVFIQGQSKQIYPLSHVAHVGRGEGLFVTNIESTKTLMRFSVRYT